MNEHHVWNLIKKYGSKVMTRKPFTVFIGRLCGDGEHKYAGRSHVEGQV